MKKSTAVQNHRAANSSIERALNFASLVEICDILIRTEYSAEYHAALEASLEDLCDMFQVWATQPEVIAAIKTVAGYLTPPND